MRWGSNPNSLCCTLLVSLKGSLLLIRTFSIMSSRWTCINQLSYLSVFARALHKVVELQAIVVQPLLELWRGLRFREFVVLARDLEALESSFAIRIYLTGPCSSSLLDLCAESPIHSGSCLGELGPLKTRHSWSPGLHSKVTPTLPRHAEPLFELLVHLLFVLDVRQPNLHLLVFKLLLLLRIDDIPGSPLIFVVDLVEFLLRLLGGLHHLIHQLLHLTHL